MAKLNYTSIFRLCIAMLAFSAFISACKPGRGGAPDCQSGHTEGESGLTHTAKAGGPRLGEKPGAGFVVDKSGDLELQNMIKNVLPRFRQYEYKDVQTGKSISYNLFVPRSETPGTTYPLVLFIADASTPGDDVTYPLRQGYGGLIWATDDWQKDYPCYVLVPQFSGVAVNDSYQHTDEVDAVIRLLKELCGREAIDTGRLYATGQSMGGMISMYYNVAYPDVFAASVFVDSHWNITVFPELVKHKFVYFIAGDAGKSYPQLKPLEKDADAQGVKYAFSEWSAKLPENEQNRLADEMFARNAPVNIIEFTPKSVLPPDGKGSEHMMSFDYAYKIKAVREWLFRQRR